MNVVMQQWWLLCALFQFWQPLPDAPYHHSVIQQNDAKMEGSPELDIFGFFPIMSLFYSLSLDVICDPKVGSNFLKMIS